MVSAITHQRITISGEPLHGAHVIVPLEQLRDVTDRLTAGGITFWVADRDFQVGGYPPVKWITLSRSADAGHVQAVLDQI